MGPSPRETSYVQLINISQLYTAGFLFLFSDIFLPVVLPENLLSGLLMKKI